jgi:hypothetical protein
MQDDLSQLLAFSRLLITEMLACYALHFIYYFKEKVYSIRAEFIFTTIIDLLP